MAAYSETISFVGVLLPVSPRRHTRRGRTVLEQTSETVPLCAFFRSVGVLVHRPNSTVRCNNTECFVNIA